jgi:hypothetical protein
MDLIFQSQIAYELVQLEDVQVRFTSWMVVTCGFPSHHVAERALMLPF